MCIYRCICMCIYVTHIYIYMYMFTSMAIKRYKSLGDVWAMVG